MPNPYDNDDHLFVTLCDTLWENGVPAPDFGKVLFRLPPNGEVSVRRQADYTEKEIKGSAATRLELKGFKTTEISFQVELGTDDDMTAIDKYDALSEAFGTLDDQKRNKVFAVQYPLINSAGVELGFISGFDAKDTKGIPEGFITATITIKEVKPASIKRKGTGSGASVETATVDQQSIDLGPAFYDYDEDIEEEQSLWSQAVNESKGGYDFSKTGLDDNE